MPVLVLLAACTGTVTPPDHPPTTTDSETVTITWVADGDTLDVEGADGTMTVRLVAINAPDRGECWADVGFDHLIDTVKGKPARLEVVGEDQFDRILAHVFVEDRHINLELVEMGMAIASTPAEDDRHRDSILDAEEVAYASRVGLWGEEVCGSAVPLPHVVFNEENTVVDPPGPDDDVLDQEQMVLVNQESAPVDLSGWVLRDESTRHRFTFAGGTVLGSGETLVIDSADPDWDPGGGSVWNNDGDMALLQDGNGTVIARWRY